MKIRCCWATLGVLTTNSSTEAFPPGWKFWEEGLFAQGHIGLDREGYLDLVFRLGTTPNGVFGAKLMWNNVPWVLERLWKRLRFRGLDRATVFHGLFPNLHLIRLVRRDRVRQAVSWARAAQEDAWVVSETEQPTPAMTPAYDYYAASAAVTFTPHGGLRRMQRSAAMPVT